METSHIGAELAELDLRLRGPGELYGTKQSGVRHLKIATFSDIELIQLARNEAKDIFQKVSSYPQLEEKIYKGSKTTITPD